MGQDCFIHLLAIVDEGAQIGEGTRIWAGTHIMPGARIGQNCNIGENCFIEDGVTVGNGVTIKNNVALYAGVEIEDGVFLGPSCVFTNVIHPRAFISRKNQFKKTIVKRGASIGANSTIICGNTVGRYALIGAGAVTAGDVPDYTLAYGCPARFRGWVCRCGVKLDFQFGRAVCPVCGAGYVLRDGAALPLEP